MNKIKVLLLMLLTIFVFSGCNLKTAEDNTAGTPQQQSGTNEVGDTGSEPGGSTGGQIPEQITGSLPGGGSASDSETGPTGGGEENVFQLLNSMSTDEKIGQMFIVGFDGTEPDDDLTEMITDRFAGGVILFQRNIKDPEQLLRLNNSIKGLNADNKAPLFIAVDEEGGSVSRMPDQLRDMPAALSVGKINSSGYAHDAGGMLAEEIAAFGFNVDFAPVLDIWSNPKNTVIGDRAFGTDPDIVSRLGTATMQGIRENGVIPVVKHFPGHGDTVTDSHVGLPKVDYDMDRLNSFELIPFRTAVDNGADAVMVAHILMSSLDKEYPASLSKAVITDLLRRQMGFDGVVITDDMTMGAIEKNYRIGDAAVKSVLAGSDILLVCHGADSGREAMDAVKAAVIDGTVSMERIDESVKRILRLKYKYKLTDQPIASADIDALNKKIDALLTE